MSILLDQVRWSGGRQQAEAVGSRASSDACRVEQDNRNAMQDSRDIELISQVPLRAILFTLSWPFFHMSDRISVVSQYAQHTCVVTQFSFFHLGRSRDIQDVFTFCGSCAVGQQHIKKARN